MFSNKRITSLFKTMKCTHLTSGSQLSFKAKLADVCRTEIHMNNITTTAFEIWCIASGQLTLQMT